MALADGDATWQGQADDEVTLGASNDRQVQWDAITGLYDVPTLSSASAPPARLRDVAMPGWADVGWRDITAVGASAVDDDALYALTTSMVDRHTVYGFTFRDHVRDPDRDLMVACVADRCQQPRDAQAFATRNYPVDLRWIAADPTVYSATATPRSDLTPGTSSTFTFTNNGNWASPSGRAWTLTITAKSTLVDPYVRSITTGQKVTWSGVTMSGDQVLELEEDRTSHIGGLRLDGYCRSENILAPYWPILQPGSNVIEVGAASGNLTCTLTTRDTYA